MDNFTLKNGNLIATRKLGFFESLIVEAIKTEEEAPQEAPEEAPCGCGEPSEIKAGRPLTLFAFLQTMAGVVCSRTDSLLRRGPAVLQCRSAICLPLATASPDLPRFREVRVARLLGRLLLRGLLHDFFIAGCFSMTFIDSAEGMVETTQLLGMNLSQDKTV